MSRLRSPIYQKVTDLFSSDEDDFTINGNYTKLDKDNSVTNLVKPVSEPDKKKVKLENVDNSIIETSNSEVTSTTPSRNNLFHAKAVKYDNICKKQTYECTSNIKEEYTPVSPNRRSGRKTRLPARIEEHIIDDLFDNKLLMDKISEQDKQIQIIKSKPTQNDIHEDTSTEKVVEYSCICVQPAKLVEDTICEARIFNSKFNVNKEQICKNTSTNFMHSPSNFIANFPVCANHLKSIIHHDCCPLCGVICESGRFIACHNVEKEKHIYCIDHFKLTKDTEKSCPHCNSVQYQRLIYMYHKRGMKNYYYPEKKKRLKTRKITRARITVTHSIIDPMSCVSSSPNNSICGETMDKNIDKYPAELTPSELYKLNELISKVRLNIPIKLKTKKYLYNACLSGDIEKVISIMGDVNINGKISDYKNQTCLHAAAIKGNMIILYYLFMNGINAELVNDTQQSALMLAIQNGRIRFAKYLMLKGVQVEISKDSGGLTPIHIACRYGHIDIAEYILDNYNINIDLKDFGGYTPIVWATESNHLAMVKFLLKRGANPIIYDDDYNTGLHWAAYSGSTPIIKLFLDGNCLLDDINNAGDMPLHIATRQGKYEAVKYLLEVGANMLEKNKKGLTPLMICTDMKCTIAKILFLYQSTYKTKQNHLENSVLLLSSDISKGKESVPVSCINEVDQTQLPLDFTYIVDNIETRKNGIHRSRNSLSTCSCIDDKCLANTCSCSSNSMRCWYDENGRLIPEYNFHDPVIVYECNQLCKCSMSCQNRVVQHGLSCRLEVFRTKKAGWGVRTLLPIQKGTFICEYVGEYLGDIDADETDDDSYLFDLDCREKDSYCIDACKYGNISRFINHRCNPNIVSIKVFMKHQDFRFPHICFFACTDIPENQELGFDYGEKFWIIKGKHFMCECNHDGCKYNHHSIKTTIDNYNDRIRLLDIK